MRILAGKYHGRVLLPPPKQAQTRPITGRAKKSVFDTLAPYLEGAFVVDLYSGTGTMGIEALSRGAEHCIFAEKDRGVVDRLNRNLQDFGAAGDSTVWVGDITITLRPRLTGIDQELDIVFVDPPYVDTRRWNWDKASANIFEPLAAKLSHDGLIVLRTPKGAEPPEGLGGLDVYRTKKYGSMLVTLLEIPRGEQPAEEILSEEIPPEE
ncbi:MAG: 16S rRNA (guanine(966)-N(2))-methyltransferase RsmD [Phycisphaerales bacterium]|jgi:16S rRNA (guanine966-N2)-methyltransferase|nr:16S rRNA (guanine(966)-N(2))-methyltransferase RsmD [Phycisphaerales bacterium]